MRRTVSVALLASALPMATVARDGRAEMTQRTRQRGLSVGNVHVCLGGAAREALRQDRQIMFDMILKDVDSGLAFVFATSSGYGASPPRGARLRRAGTLS